MFVYVHSYVCIRASVMHEFRSKYSSTGKACQLVTKVAKGSGFSEQIVAPGNSQTVHSLAVGCHQ